MRNQRFEEDALEDNRTRSLGKKHILEYEGREGSACHSDSIYNNNRVRDAANKPRFRSRLSTKV
jgi:hypothetical protein